MNFCTLFLRTENVHLMKDIGQLPFCLKNDYGYHSYIATYKNGEYPYLESEVKGLELQFVNKSFLGQAFDGIHFLIKMYREIDVLNVYHLNLNSFLWILFFKMLRGKRGIAYLKLDANHIEVGKLQKKNLKSLIKKITLRIADIISAESSTMQTALQKYSKTPIIYVPNGYLSLAQKANKFYKKENIVLTVGRLGDFSKATELLVEAFFKSELEASWKLVLIGPTTEQFGRWIENKFLEYPDASNRLLVLGSIDNKDVLREWYCRAKVFALPSRYEGFPIVLIEAMIQGCYIITSDAVLPAKDLIQDDKIGCIVKVNSQDELDKALAEASQLKIDWDKNAKHIRNSIEDRFLWKNILKILDNRIRRCQEENECRTQK